MEDGSLSPANARATAVVADDALEVPRLRDEGRLSSVPKLRRPKAPNRRFQLSTLAPLILVAAAIGFNLWALRDERLVVQNVNDTSVHLAMVKSANQVITSGHLPFDAWWPRVSLGVPQFHVYQSLGHIIAAYVATIFGAATTVQWILYLGLALWPLSVYWGARLFELDRWTAACAAAIAPLLMSITGYGYEHQSYIWRGNGLWSQLWAMWMLPLALPLCWRAVRRGKGYAIAALALGLTFAFHFLTGYLAMAAMVVWILVSPREIGKRVARTAVVGAGALLAIAWVVVPLLVDSRYAAQTMYNRNTFWDDSYGARKILGWLFTGQLFDHGRFPVVTLLVGVGFAVCVVKFRRDERFRAIASVFVLSLVLFFGRATFGPLTKLLPGSDDLLMHRFISGVHLAGILLAGIGAAAIGRSLFALTGKVRVPELRMVAPVALPVLFVLVLLPAIMQIWSFDRQDASWIHQQRAADSTDGADLQKLVDIVRAAGDARVYAGMTNNWGRAGYDVYATPVYEQLLQRDADAIGFTLRTVSLVSDVEVKFDDQNPDQYDLFNVGYLILPADRAAPKFATLIASAGRHRLYRVPTTGYLEVVDTVAPAIKADRRTMGDQPAAFLNSSLLAQRRFPTVAFGGSPAASPSLAPADDPQGPAGTVQSQYALPDEGQFGGVVQAVRPAVVLLKA
ncbi:MAG: hypothetical protein JOZ99_09230, partial [Actinobacteria bacterium]|nr:hypothetical protein [Actinomycetota bacterium]